MDESPVRIARPPRKLRYAFYALAAVVLTATATIAYLAATFDPRDYHRRIVDVVRDKTGRTLKIEGEVALSFWPDVGVRLGALSLSERGSDERFASVEAARLTLDLVPLFSREVVASEVVIVGAHVALIRDRDGKLNIDDLLGGEGAAPRLDIGRLAVERSALSYRDLSSGAQYELSGITLETGRIADGVAIPLGLMLNASDSKDTFALKSVLKGRLTLDLARKRQALDDARIEVSGRVPGMSDIAAQASAGTVARTETGELRASAVSGSLQGNHGQDAIAVAFDASSASFAGDRAAGEAVRLSLVAKGPAGTTNVKIELPSVQRVADRIESRTNALDLKLQRGGHRIQAAISALIEADTRTRRVALSGVAADFTVFGPRLPHKGVTGVVRGDARLDVDKEGVQFQLAGRVAESQVKARITAAGIAAPVYTFAVEVDQLDLDRYIASGSNRRKEGQVRAATADGQNLLAPLMEVPATGTLSIGVLKSSNTTATNVKLSLQ